jgi:putative PEP-CTERM system histidine kinase
MPVLRFIDLIAAFAGLALALLVLLFPRFGVGSRSLAFFLVPGALVSICLGTAGLLPAISGDEAIRLALAFLIVCAAGGCHASRSTGVAKDGGEVRRLNRLVEALVALGAIASVIPYLYSIAGASGPIAAWVMDSYGRYVAPYLLLTSVLSLASIEQTFRSAEEHIRWEIKFLLLGVASSFAAIVYVAATMFLYPWQYLGGWGQSIAIFPFIFLLSCGLIFQSWRRSTGRHRIVVSQGVVYSTITLVSVGVYLLLAGAAARWASQWTLMGIPVEPFVFIVLIAALLTILSATAFRHRAKRWIRQNLFVGRYDYRQFWMEASELVRSVDGTTVPADALAALIERALGSLDITVWLRLPNSDDMQCAAVRGLLGDQLPMEIPQLVGRLKGINHPLSVDEWKNRALPDWPEDALRQAKASLIVPLVSASRIVGVLTIGADRSGKPFDWETREFLRVVAAHFATEFHKSELLSRMVESREAETLHSFSAFLLHDLKNYASTLSLIATNASRHHSNPAFQRDSLQSIVDVSEKIKRLCNSLRTFSATLAANKERQDLNDILRSVAHSFQASTGRDVRLTLSPIPPVVVDREEIVRLIHNLMLNSHEASFESGIIQVASFVEDHDAVIAVTDSGKGISDRFLKEGLFQAFHTTKPDGLGIGLFHSKKIVEAHSGSIEVNSRMGKGTTIRVILPLSDSPYLETINSDRVSV